MRQFSLGGAWSAGIDFLRRALVRHLILLLGVGIAVPLALQFLLVGSPVGGFAALGAGEGAAGGSLTAEIVELAAYVVQLGSLFAALRIGLAPGSTLGGSLLYGLAASPVVLIGLAIPIGLAVYAFYQVAPIFSGVLVVLGVAAVSAILFTLLAAVFAVGLLVMLALAILFGAASGDVGLAATLVGGSGFVVVLLIVGSGATLLLATRLSCAAALMAQRRSFNLVAAVRESWDLTWDDQWRILLYLAAFGLGVTVLLFGGAVATGYGVVALQGGSSADATLAGQIFGAAAAVPVVFLSAMVPAGIYRELAGSGETAADVFA